MNLITGLSIDNLVFDGSNFILQEVKGLESPTVRLPRYNLPGSSGAFVSNALYGERAIKIKGVVNAPDGQPTTYLANRNTLINALSYKRDVNDEIVPQTLTMSLVNGQVLTTQVYVDTPLAMGFSPDQSDYEEFLITFIAPDPGLYSSTPSTSTITFPVVGGTSIPTAVPLSLAPSSGGSALVNNLGAITTYPVITINAPVVNPYIVNLTTGKFIGLNYTLEVGNDPIIIDCYRQTITQGGNDKSGVQIAGSSFWGFAAGINSLSYSGSSGSGIVSITFYPTYLGV